MISMSKKINHRGPDSNDIYLEKKNNNLTSKFEASHS